MRNKFDDPLASKRGDDDEIMEWLKTHPVVDKDFSPGRLSSKSRDTSERQNLSTKRGEQRLLVDLHGLRYEEAETVVRSTLARAEIVESGLRDAGYVLLERLDGTLDLATRVAALVT